MTPSPPPCAKPRSTRASPTRVGSCPCSERLADAALGRTRPDIIPEQCLQPNERTGRDVAARAVRTVVHGAGHVRHRDRQPIWLRLAVRRPPARLPCGRRPARVHADGRAHRVRPVLVRIEYRDSRIVHRVLDAGARGIIFPTVDTAQQAADAVAMCRYPPNGRRSWGPARLALAHPGYSTEAADDEVVCIVMVESRAGPREPRRDPCGARDRRDPRRSLSDLAIDLGVGPQPDPLAGPHADALRTIASRCAAAGSSRWHMPSASPASRCSGISVTRCSGSTATPDCSAAPPWRWSRTSGLTTRDRSQPDTPAGGGWSPAAWDHAVRRSVRQPRVGAVEGFRCAAPIRRRPRRPVGDAEMQPGQQPMQRRALVGVQAGQHLLLDHVDRFVDLTQRPLALVRQLHDRAAAIGAIPAPEHELRFLEVVEQADHARCVETEPLGEQLLRSRPVAAQVGERDHVPLAQSERRENLFKALADDPRDPRDQDGGLRRRLCRRQRRARTRDACGQFNRGIPCRETRSLGHS